MDKSAAVNDLLDFLRRELGAAAFQVVNHWDDPNAIGIAHPNNAGILAYIALYGEHDVYVELELPPTDDDYPYTPAGLGQRTNCRELPDIIRQHFVANSMAAV